METPAPSARCPLCLQTPLASHDPDPQWHLALSSGEKGQGGFRLGCLVASGGEQATAKRCGPEVGGAEHRPEAPAIGKALVRRWRPQPATLTRVRVPRPTPRCRVVTLAKSLPPGGEISGEGFRSTDPHRRRLAGRLRRPHRGPRRSPPSRAVGSPGREFAPPRVQLELRPRACPARSGDPRGPKLRGAHQVSPWARPLSGWEYSPESPPPPPARARPARSSRKLPAGPLQQRRRPGGGASAPREPMSGHRLSLATNPRLPSGGGADGDIPEGSLRHARLAHTPLPAAQWTIPPRLGRGGLYHSGAAEGGAAEGRRPMAREEADQRPMGSWDPRTTCCGLSVRVGGARVLRAGDRRWESGDQR